MAAGHLRDRVTFFSPTKVTDVLRGQTVTYTSELATVWAHWRGLTTRETLVAQGMQTLPAARLVIRYRADITTQLRVQRGVSGPLYEIASVNDPDGRRIWLDLDLVEVP
jgi:SPP1 family predicted phage head-tail adaptor